MNLRREARNRPCMVRIPGVCNHDDTTTVLAHYRLAGTCGTGMKPPDLLGAWACSACHSVAGDRDHRLAEGVMRTQAKLIGEGKVTW